MMDHRVRYMSLEVSMVDHRGKIYMLGGEYCGP